MRIYTVTMIHGHDRTVRKIIAHDSIHAAIIGLGMMPQTGVPLSIFCKPEGNAA